MVGPEGASPANDYNAEKRQTWPTVEPNSTRRPPRPANQDGAIIRPFRGETSDPGKLGPVQRLDWLLAVTRDAELTKPAVAVAGVLVEHVNAASGLAWPGQSLIMRMAGIKDRSTVKRAVRRLVARGWIAVEAGGMHQNGGQFSNRYRLIFPRMLPAPTD